MGTTDTEALLQGPVKPSRSAAKTYAVNGTLKYITHTATVETLEYPHRNTVLVPQIKTGPDARSVSRDPIHTPGTG